MFHIIVRRYVRVCSAFEPPIAQNRPVKPFLLLPALAMMALSHPALAQDAAVSPWSKGTHSSLRLIAGATAASGKQRVGVEIVMDPGYKTYWRSPGDAGVPPVFDWSGSENVGGLDVRWPTPERFEDGNGYSIGYVGEVVVPISVTPVDPQKPVTLELKLDYAVCEKICIPAKGEARLWLEPGVTSVSSPRLERFEARVPVPVKFGMRKDKLSVLEVAPDENGTEPGLRVLLHVPAEGIVEDIFVEGPGMWSFGKPTLIPQADGTVAAFVKINDRPKGASGPIPFVVTVRGKPTAIESRLELDIPVAKP